MNSGLKTLMGKAGTFSGYGVNHEGQRFRGTLVMTPRFEGKGLTLDFTATGDDGTIYHKEHSTLGLTPAEGVSLWVLSNNHPGVVEHRFADGDPIDGAESTIRFSLGNADDQNSFRETISVDLWPNGDLSYRYAWGLPGAEFAERSSVRMTHGRNQTIPEAKIKETETGLAPEGDGWYVINAKEARWHKNGKFGESCGFEGSRRFEQYGINIHVIEPGQPNCHYHGEDDQENFLVLKGQCKLLIEGQERLLREWDFVHCPKWTKHVFIGTGNEPCAILMVGGRTGHGVTYPAIELTKSYNASPDKDTDSPKVSYVGCPEWLPTRAAWISNLSPEIDVWHVAIPVANLERAVDFYSRVLSFTLIGRDDYPSKKQAFVAVQRGGFTVELFEPKGPTANLPKHPDHLAFECKDIANFRAKLVEAGVDVSEIEEYDNGVKQISVSDPDGIRIDLFQGRALYERSVTP